MAYYRAGRARRTELDTNFWLTANGNFFDICVLEWCKLFADPKDPHHWSAIVRNRSAFDDNLHDHLKMDRGAFTAYRRQVRWHRDKFVAHLDSEAVMYLPLLDHAKRATEFYHGHVTEHELEPESMPGLIGDLRSYYKTCYREAVEMFDQQVE